MVTPNLGGRGAVRSVCDLLVAARQHAEPAAAPEEAPVIARVVIVLAIVGIILGALFLGQGGPAPPVQPETDRAGATCRATPRAMPKSLETGEDGRPEFVVVSPLIRQQANDERVQLDAPRMTFVSAENGTWHAQSRSGLIRADWRERRSARRRADGRHALRVAGRHQHQHDLVRHAPGDCAHARVLHRRRARRHARGDRPASRV